MTGLRIVSSSYFHRTFIGLLHDWFPESLPSSAIGSLKRLLQCFTLYNIHYYTSARYISLNLWYCLLNRSYVPLETIFVRIHLMWQKFIAKEIFYNLHYSIRLNISTIEDSTFLIAKRNPLAVISVLTIENRNFVICDEYCFPANEYLISKAKWMMQY